MIKTANITDALIRNVDARRKWYKNPPSVNPIILAKLLPYLVLHLDELLIITFREFRK